MTKPRTKSKVSGWLFHASVILMIFSLSLVNSSYVFAAEKFSVDAEINLKKLNHPDKLKVVISANGDTETKYLIGKDLNSNSATVSFELDQKK